MAFFIPADCDFTRRPMSERVVYEKLREKLSSEWLVFYSFCFQYRDNGRILQDHEADFLLFHQEKGFLVLEVKGGKLPCRDGKWLQDDHEIQSPAAQARDNKYAILHLLEDKLQRKVPLRFAHAVCFPFCDSEHDTVWPPDTQNIVITCRELADENLEERLGRFIDETQLPPGIQGVLTQETVLDMLAPEFEYLQPMQEEAPAPPESESEVFLRLTEQQYGVLKALKNFPRLLIKGGAGTGKTLLALKKAQEVAASGGSVLYLCFNELLARKVEKELARRHSPVQAAAFFDFGRRLLKIPQEEYDRYRDDPRLYSKVLPELLVKYLKENTIGYDAVIVDEGQDFTPQMWEVVSLLLAPSTLFYVFYDPDQNIFWERVSLPEFPLPPVELTMNCRNARRIAEVIKPYCSTEMQIPEESPEGAEVVRRVGDMREMLAEEFQRLLKVERVMQTDIVVLGGHSLDNTSLGSDHQVGAYRLVETTKGLGSKEVRYLTYMKFKGCEAKVVVLMDVNESDARWGCAGLYTAMSRAVRQLVVLERP